jgi:hypothetical protein
LTLPRLSALPLVFALTLSSSLTYAEEGMWTFDNIPVAQIQKKYGFAPTQAWLDHVRLSSIRLNDGGSGSFISPDGLLLTNHHVARGQLQKNSSAEHDYIKNGFYAATQDQEMKSQDLEINVLQSLKDVTKDVQGAAAGKSEADALKAKRGMITKIEGDAQKSTGLEAQVVPLYNGGQYWLYLYKKYTDVRIVFAPEQQTAFFGGDPDNFTYPRYDVDFAIFRVYENGKPIHTDNWLRWNSAGAKPGELVFTSGHPGSTERDDTLSQVKLERDFVNPLVVKLLTMRISALKQYAQRGPEQARQVASDIFGLENGLKVYVGRVTALSGKEILPKKEAEETDFKQKVRANPELQKAYGSAWDEIDAADNKIGQLRTLTFFRSSNSTYAGFANSLVNYAVESKKPDAERLNGYHDAQMPGLRFRLTSTAPIYPELELANMTAALELAKQMLPPDDPWLVAELQGRTPSEAAKAYVSSTKLGDVAYRKQLLDGGQAAIDASHDPFIELARKLDPLNRALSKRLDTEASAPLTAAEEKLSKARFAVYGTSRYPDATFTLRLSYGSVEGFPYNGTIAPPYTTLYGLYDRSASFGDKVPFDLPKRWVDGRSKLDLSTPVDFVSTNDITGGNSGSPVINQKAELVGLVFDGNIESLAGDFVYDGTANRGVNVHTAIMMEALRKLYGANALADEIEAAAKK